MAEVKFTKQELRNQQNKLAQLQKYLPTLQLKKAMLQTEVSHALAELSSAKEFFDKELFQAKELQILLSNFDAGELFQGLKVASVKKTFENIAGVEIPIFESVEFEPFVYSFYDTPIWFDDTLVCLQKLIEGREKIVIAEERKRLLEKELRDVSIRVNLFEKILIPKALSNIRKIRVFLGDQQLAAVAQAKIAKQKIEAKKKITQGLA